MIIQGGSISASDSGSQSVASMMSGGWDVTIPLNLKALEPFLSLDGRKTDNVLSQHHAPD